MKYCVGVIAALGLAGCIVSTYDYAYIYLGEKMTVTARGKATAGPLYFHEEMPIEYELRRSEYTIKATLDIDSLRPAVFIGVGEDTEREISITGEFASTCFGNFLNGHAEIHRPGSGDLYFIWIKNQLPRCSGQTNLATAKQYLTITVSDFSGHVIATEVLPFSIRKNGVLVQSDI